MKDVTVIFDLDGTMIDTAPDLIAAANHTLGRFGMPPVAEHIVEPAVGVGSRAMLQAALASLGRDPGERVLTDMTTQFIDYYGEHICVGSRPYPGLIEALDALTKTGALLGVCTNKREALALKLLAELRLDRYFAAIAGADHFPVRKPDPRHLLGTIAMAGGDPHRSVMIGDSLADAGAARSAGIPFVAVTFGYGEPLEALKPDAVISHFDELLPALEALPSLK